VDDYARTALVGMLTLSIHGDLAGRVSERRKVLLTWENEGVEANILP
jgi:hypothetical protein